MQIFVKQFHWIIILYTAMTVWMALEEHEQKVEQVTQVTQSLEIKKKKLRTKLGQIDKFRKNLEASQKRVNEVLQQIEKLQKQLPSDSNDAVVQNILGKKAEEIKMINPIQEPGDEKNKGFYLSREYIFKAEGTYLQFLIFMENVANSERILNVTSFKLDYSKKSNRSSQQILEMKTVIESFRYNSDYKPPKANPVPAQGVKK